MQTMQCALSMLFLICWISQTLGICGERAQEGGSTGIGLEVFSQASFLWLSSCVEKRPLQLSISGAFAFQPAAAWWTYSQRPQHCRFPQSHSQGTSQHVQIIRANCQPDYGKIILAFCKNNLIGSTMALSFFRIEYSLQKNGQQIRSLINPDPN